MIIGQQVLGSWKSRLNGVGTRNWPAEDNHQQEAPRSLTCCGRCAEGLQPYYGHELERVRECRLFCECILEGRLNMNMYGLERSQNKAEIHPKQA